MFAFVLNCPRQSLSIESSVLALPHLVKVLVAFGTCTVADGTLLLIFTEFGVFHGLKRF